MGHAVLEESYTKPATNDTPSQEFSGGGEATAECSLLSAIHGRDTVDSALLSAELRQHLQAATGKRQVGSGAFTL